MIQRRLVVADVAVQNSRRHGVFAHVQERHVHVRQELQLQAHEYLAQIELLPPRFIVDDDDVFGIAVPHGIDAVDLPGDDDFQAVGQGKAQSLPRAALAAEGLFQPFHMKLGRLAELAKTPHRPGQGLNKAFLDLREIGVGHEDVVLYIRGEPFRSLAARGRNIFRSEVAPLLVFAKQVLA